MHLTTKRTHDDVKPMHKRRRLSLRPAARDEYDDQIACFDRTNTLGGQRDEGYFLGRMGMGEEGLVGNERGFF